MSLSYEGASGGRIAALDDVSLSVPRGAFTALLGVNGAGKTTLFSLVTRLYNNTSGTIRVAGHDLRRQAQDHGAQHDAHHLRVLALDTREHVVAVAVGKHDVEKYYGREAFRHGLHEVVNGVEAIHLNVRHFQAAGHQIADTLVVFQ